MALWAQLRRSELERNVGSQDFLHVRRKGGGFEGLVFTPVGHDHVEND
jgi:hypothetical protein